ncbi:tumor susceptibility gene 101 protein [Cololabis saira]|uniref:tumor susceptibility gene 101 protein n=1 Tax=Cololabis saira TaxID=129043 RepID=UPI002AD42913|nr:tumor susceptibility gene 101 protein [Cololabis saira]
MSFREKTIKKMLPKAYLRKYVAHEIYVALTFFKNLVPVMDRYVYNDGTTKDLMSLTGTIPVMISDANYNIPICIWFEESYPQDAPICYVKPTSEMVVVTGTYVSNNGEILLPYLQDWKNGECDLVSLLQVMVAVFGESPPVAKRPYPEHEQASCWLQCREADENSYLSLTREDGQSFQQQNESNC